MKQSPFSVKKIVFYSIVLLVMLAGINLSSCDKSCKLGGSSWEGTYLFNDTIYITFPHDTIILIDTILTNTARLKLSFAKNQVNAQYENSGTDSNASYRGKYRCSRHDLTMNINKPAGVVEWQGIVYSVMTIQTDSKEVYKINLSKKSQK